MAIEMACIGFSVACATVFGKFVSFCISGAWFKSSQVSAGLHETTFSGARVPDWF